MLRKKISIIMFLILGVFITSNNVFADENNHMEVTGTAAILLERSTGRVLFEYNPDLVIYPASMIKVLTAIVALEYIDENDIVVVGTEINHVPPLSSRAGHIMGEHITGLNLIRGLLLPSGNDTANIVVAHVAREHTGNNSLSFQEAEEIFTGLMNKRAAEIGAVKSNFTNAHGFHDPNLYTTVRELAMIAEAAMQNEVIRRVAAEAVFVGNSGGGLVGDDVLTREISWSSTNRMLVGRYYNTHVTGLKTGFTDQAGLCFMGTARRNGVELISVIAGSIYPDRWLDTTALFEYGFNNYSLRTVHHTIIPVDEMDIHNPRWGDDTSVQIFGDENFIYFLTQEEFASIERIVEYDTERISILEVKEDDVVVNTTIGLIAPISAGEVIGQVTYTLNGSTLFSGNLVVNQHIYERTIRSDIAYVFSYLQDNAFSIYGVSFVLICISLSMLVHKVVSILRRRKKKRSRLRKNRIKYHL